MASRESIIEDAEEAREQTLETIRELTAAGETDAMGGGVPMARLVAELEWSRGAIKGYVTTLREENKIRKVDGRCSGHVRPSYLPVEDVDEVSDGDSSQEIRTDGGTDPANTERSPLQDNRSDAVLSDCGEYRYRLSRTWDVEKPAIAFVMLNPSTADATDNDPTIRRCLGFAKDWGYGSLVVANLFALRTPAPSNLSDHSDPVGPENDDHLRNVCEQAEKIVAAWGANGSLNGRAIEVAETLGSDLFALDTTKEGHPVHPLYQPADAEPVLWTEGSLRSGDDRDG